MRVNIDSAALNEPRIARLARQLKISRYEALGRCIHVWMLCYERRLEFVSIIDADIAGGELPGFVEALVSEEMADRVDDGKTIRVRGVAKRINFLEQQGEKGRLSGKRRREMSDELQKRTSVQQGFSFGSSTGSSGPRTYSPDLDLSQAPDQAPDHIPRRSSGGAKLHAVSERSDSDEGYDTAPPHEMIQPVDSGELLERDRRLPEQPPEQAFTLAHLLIQLVCKSNPSGRLSRSAPRIRSQSAIRWAPIIDKLNRIDKFTWGEIEGMIQWAHKSTFWCGVILGADSLREHWDKMAAQRQIPRNPQVSHRKEPSAGPTELAHRELDELRSKAAP